MRPEAGPWWIAGLCSEVDFTRVELLHEVAMIGVVTKGAFTYDVVRDLPWPDYEELMQKVPETIAQAYKKAQQEIGRAAK